MVVDVALAKVFLLGILMLLVLVRNPWVIVFVSVRGGEMRYVLARPMVMGDVHVVMVVHNSFMVMAIGHFPLRECRSSQFISGRTARSAS
jgi:hypothetical protein